MFNIQEATVPEILKEFVPRYNRGTGQSNVELVNQFYLEYYSKGYTEVVKTVTNLEPFYRTFIKLRCFRERTKDLYYRRRFGSYSGKISFIEFVNDSFISDSSQTSNVAEEIPARSIDNPSEILLARERNRLAISMRKQLISKLSKREAKAVYCLMLGCTRREIAKKLNVSLGTAQNIVSRIRRMPEIKKLKEILS